RQAHFDHFRRRLDLCQQFKIRTLTVITDFTRQVQGSDNERAIDSLREAAQWAAGFDVRLALEFRGTDALCASLPTALHLIGLAGEPNLGICLDLFHYYKGPSKFEDLDGLTRQNLFLVQVSDVAGLPRELMTDSDRVFPGDGDFQLLQIVRKLHEI